MYQRYKAVHHLIDPLIHQLPDLRPVKGRKDSPSVRQTFIQPPGIPDQGSDRSILFVASGEILTRYRIFGWVSIPPKLPAEKLQPPYTFPSMTMAPPTPVP